MNQLKDIFNQTKREATQISSRLAQEVKEFLSLLEGAENISENERGVESSHEFVNPSEITYKYNIEQYLRIVNLLPKVQQFEAMHQRFVQGNWTLTDEYFCTTLDLAPLMRRDPVWHNESRSIPNFDILNSDEFILGLQGAVTPWFYNNMRDLIQDLQIHYKWTPTNKLAHFQARCKRFLYVRLFADIDLQRFEIYHQQTKDRASFIWFKRFLSAKFNGSSNTLPDDGLFIGQGDDNDESYLGRFKDWMTTKFNNMKEWTYSNFIKKPKDCIREIIKSVVDRFSGIFSLFGDFYNNYLSSFVDKFCGVIAVFFNFGDGLIAKGFRLIKLAVVAIAITLIAALGFIGMKILGGIFSIMKYMISGPSANAVVNINYDRFKGEGPDGVAGLGAMIVELFPWSDDVSSKILKWCKNLVALTAAGTIIKYSAASILGFLPTVLRDSITYQFGSQDQRDVIDVSNWKAEAVALVSASKLTNVLMSDVYQEKLTKVLKEGSVLIERVKNPGVRSMFLSVYAKLLTQYTILQQNVMKGATRSLPFSMHIYGIPGVGKTQIVNRINRDVFEAQDNNVFHVPKEPYWSGFTGEEHIVMDEFSIGGKELREETGLTYIQLISTEPFQPPLASVDNQAVGIKGTQAYPKSVITLNNDYVTRINGIPNEALDRRRNVVIQLLRSKYWKSVVGNPSNLDLSQYTLEEKRNMVWLNACFMSPVPDSLAETKDATPDYKFGAPMTIPVLLERLKSIYHNHNDLIESMKIVSGANPDTRSPQEIIDDLIRKSHGIPNKPLPLKDVLFNYLKDNFVTKAIKQQFFGEGSNGKTKKKVQSKTDVLPTSGSQRRKPSKPITKRDLEEKQFKPIRGNISNATTPLLDVDKMTVEQLTCKVRNHYRDTFKKEYPYMYESFDTITITTICHVLGIDGPNPNGDYLKECRDFVKSFGEYSDYDSCSDHRSSSSSSSESDDEIILEEVVVETTSNHEKTENNGDNLTNLPIMEIGDSIRNDPRMSDFDFVLWQGFKVADTLELSFVNDNVQFNFTGDIVYGAYIVELDFPVALLEDELERAEILYSNKGIKIDKVPSWKKGFYDLINRVNIGYIITVILVCITMYKVIRGQLADLESNDNEEITFSGQGVAYSDEKDKPPRKGYRAARMTKFTGHSRTAKAVALHCAWDIINLIPIGGRKFLTFYHWLTKHDVSEPLNCTLVDGSTRIPVLLDSNLIQADPVKDVCILEFVEKQVPMYANRVKDFVSKNEVLNVDKLQICLEFAERTKYGPGTLITGPKTYDFNNVVYEQTSTFMYKIPTKPGDCGTVVRAHDKLGGKILGFHIAGSSGTGMCVIMTKEELQSFDTYPEIDPNEVFKAQGNSLEIGQNVVSCSIVPIEERVFLPNTTSITKSPLYGKLNHESAKEPAILTAHDPRSAGKCPIIQSLNSLNLNDNFHIEEDRLDAVFANMKSNYDRDLDWIVGKRQLSFEEAIVGVPGKLSSINTATSPGYPLIYRKTKPGKKDHVRIYSDGTHYISDDIRELTSLKLEDMKNYNGDEINHRFIGYLKDELVSKSKIEKVKTRMIFCNSMVSSIAFRMKAGALLAAYQNSWTRVPMAIGVNPNSHDMDNIYLYLSEVGTRFMAGDYEAFDQRHQIEFRKRAYDMIGMQLKENGLVTTEEWNYMVEHETKTPIQIDKYLISTKSNHLSGCFWTTILNCLVNEAYIRYAFSVLEPHLLFDDEVRIKVLGDDNVICFSDKVNLKPLEFQQQLANLGQSYTHAEKGKELENYYHKFEDILFLGCVPRLVGGKYTGAQRKEILWQSPQWFKSKETDLEQIVRQNMEFASQWDKEFYQEYLESINTALIELGYEPYIGEHYFVQRVVSARTTREGERLMTYPLFKGEGKEVDGLTTITTETGLAEGDWSADNRKTLANQAVNEKSMDVNYGTDSIVFRKKVTWTTSDLGLIWHARAPFGLLTLDETENLQNMPFNNFIYTVTDMELIVQVNGTPFQQGLVYLFFAPLTDLTLVGQRPTDENILNYQGVEISPNENGTYVLKATMQFFRSVLNTYAGAQGEDFLGTFGLYVRSALQSVEPSQVVFSISTRFPNSQFSIARPVPTTAAEAQADSLTMAKFKNLSSLLLTPQNFATLYPEFKGEGNSVSTTNVNTTNHVHDVVGSVPTEIVNTPSNTATAEGSLSVPALPLDKPPLASGTLPIFTAVPSNSKNTMLEPVMAYQHHPAMMHREPLSVCDTSEFAIANMCAKEDLYHDMIWTTSQGENHQLLQFPFNSILKDGTSAAGANLSVGTAVYTLNLSQFWRADLELNFRAIKTRFHSGRLCLTIAYGAPSLAPANKNVFINHILNFSNDNSQNSVLVKYNASTEFLATYMTNANTRLTNPTQDYTVARIMVTVHNVLVAADTVPQEVRVLMGVKFRNVRVYETNTIIPFSKDSTSAVVNYATVGTAFKGEGIDVIPTDEVKIMEDPEIVETTKSETEVQALKPCRLVIGRKFEYTIAHLEEHLRRYVPIPLTKSRNLIINGVRYTALKFRCDYGNIITRFAKVWSGHLNVRVIVTSAYPVWTRLITAFEYDSTPLYPGVNLNGAQGGWTVSDTSAIGAAYNPTQRTTENGAQEFLPNEMATPYGNGSWLVNASIPFNTHLNVLRIAAGQSDRSNANIKDFHSVFHIYVREDNPEYMAFGSVGDDFKLGVFCPAPTYFRPMNNGSSTLYSFNGRTWNV